MEVGGEASDNYSLPGNLAEAYYWTPGKREQAKELYRQAISRAEKSLQVNSRDGSVLSSLALYHAMLSDRQEANSYLQHALLRHFCQHLAHDRLQVTGSFGVEL